MNNQPAPKVVALVCVRNEEVHVSRCIEDWIANGCEVILIDHASEDRTIRIARSYSGRGLLSIERLPWRGYFSLKDQIRTKHAIAQIVEHDWVVHADVDEWLCPPPGMGGSLAAAIQLVHAKGYTCINFHEMVFVPLPGEDFTNTHYSRVMCTYYFFQPDHPRAYPRLMRAWRRDIAANSIETGGHILEGYGISLYPTDFILRHYPALSVDHAYKKYNQRRFDPAELAIHWHQTRQNIRRDQFLLKSASQLKRLPRWDSDEFNYSTPSRKHFWEVGFYQAGPCHGGAISPTLRSTNPHSH